MPPSVSSPVETRSSSAWPTVIRWRALIRSTCASGSGVESSGVGVGHVVGNSLSGALRNPAAAKEQTATLFLGIAFAEALGIFGFLIAMLLMFAV